MSKKKVLVEEVFEEITIIDKNVVELIEVKRKLNSRPTENDRTILLARQTELQGKI
jgi:hypothetical protein